jgi:hypothetical protein
MGWLLQLRLFTHIYICYATVRSLARADLRHAPLLYVLWHLYTHIMLFYCTFTCTQTCDLLPAHTNKGWGWVGWGNNVHLCAHRSCYAEDVLVLRHAWGKLGQNEFLLAKSCTHVRIRYYALEHTHMECDVIRSSLSLAHSHTHMWDATF